MTELTTIVIILVLVLSLFLHYESKYADLTYVTSTIDQRPYLVRNRDDKQEAANMLATIRNKLTSLVQILHQQESSDPKVQRLVEKFNPENISESLADSNYTSYSVNKGEKIVFCIREKTSEQKLEDLNTMMFVAIHELSHIMTLSIGHTDEFWANMRYLLQKAIDAGIYKKQNFRKQPREYCGVKITDSPLE